MTDVPTRDRPPEDSEIPTGDRQGPTGADPGADGPVSRGVLDNAVARRAGLAVFVAAMVGLAVTSTVGPQFAVMVLLPLCVAMVSAEFGAAAVSTWARVATVVGLVLWLSVTGGLPMLLVVAAVIAMIFLHELGHYIAARRAGMLATEFFLGFGTKIWSFQRGETEFGLKAIPAGAYVKIIGMNNLEEVDPALESRTYRQAPFRSRLGVAVAGSAMHFAIALVLLVVQFAFIGRASEDRWTVDEVTEASAAEAAGVRAGDRPLRLGSEEVGSFEEFRDLVLASPSGETTLVVERAGEEVDLLLDLRRRAKVIGTVGEDLDLIEGTDGLTVGPVKENGRLDRAGVAEGATVVAINGVPVQDFSAVAEALGESEGGEVVLETSRGEATVSLGSAVALTEPRPFVGVGAQPELETDSLPAATGSAVAEFGRGVGASVAGIGMVFWPPNLVGFFSDTVTGSERDVSDDPTPAEEVAVSSDGSRPMSIIGAVAYGADLTAENASNLIAFLIGLNIFIGVFNLIPLLPFDGGHVSIAVYEKVQEMRRRQSNRYIADITRMIPVAYTVVMVLVVVGLMAMYLDLTRGVTT